MSVNQWPIILILCLIIICKIFGVSSSGVYMNAYKGNLRNRFDSSSTLTSASSSPLLNGISTKIPKAGALKEADELFSKCNGIEIRELTIPQVQHYFRTNQLTSLDLTNCYLQRINHMNPYLNAIIQVNPDAIKQAFQADMERGKRTGALHGIPILLKDNIGTKDLMETTAGSLALLGVRPKRDALSVQALRKAGAVILGKANLSEFAAFRGTNIPNGWSGRGGQTRNAYNLGADPEGSSSGSGVAVAANLAMVALGTETDGSLMAPASVSALCVLKPTLGTPSTKGVIPLSHTQDNIGPMARTTMDLAMLLDVLLENRGQTQPLGCGLSFTECLYRENYDKRLRVGVLRHPFWSADIINSTDLHAQLPLLENIVDTMKSSSQFEMVDPVSSTPGLLEKISGAKELIVLSHDFKQDINSYLANEVTYQFPIPPNQKFTLKDLIRFNQQYPNQFGYNQDLLILSETTDGTLNTTYLAAKENNRRNGIELLNSVLVKYSLDAVMLPTEPRIDGVFDVTLKDSPVVGFSVAAVAGFPSVNVPAGIGLNGVPFGMTFIGLPHTEARLLQVAHALELLTPRRQPPLFLV